MNDNVDVDSIDKKIIIGFEKIAQTLNALAWHSGKPYQLNPMQARLLAFLSKHKGRGHRITMLAKEFGVSKASISESVSALQRKQLISKSVESGNRNTVIATTPLGQLAAIEAGAYTNLLALSINNLPPANKENLFKAIHQLVFALYTNGALPVQRMCFNCGNYILQNGDHYCTLLKTTLATTALEIDCPDHIRL